MSRPAVAPVRLEIGGPGQAKSLFTRDRHPLPPIGASLGLKSVSSTAGRLNHCPYRFLLLNGREKQRKPANQGLAILAPRCDRTTTKHHSSCYVRLLERRLSTQPSFPVFFLSQAAAIALVACAASIVDLDSPHKTAAACKLDRRLPSESPPS